MTIAVHSFMDLVNLQTVCKSPDLRVYKFIDSSCQNTDFHSPSSHLAPDITGNLHVLLKIHSNSLPWLRVCVSNNYQGYSYSGFHTSSALLQVCHAVRRLISLFIV